jgi:hypothetical protein
MELVNICVILYAGNKNIHIKFGGRKGNGHV